MILDNKGHHIALSLTACYYNERASFCGCHHHPLKKHIKAKVCGPASLTHYNKQQRISKKIAFGRILNFLSITFCWIRKLNIHIPSKWVTKHAFIIIPKINK